MGLLYAVDGWWHILTLWGWCQNLLRGWRAKYKNGQVFLMTSEKVIPILLAEQFCKCNLSLCPWFVSSISSLGLAAYLIHTVFPVASVHFRYFVS